MTTFDTMLCLGLGLVIGFGTGWFAYRGRQLAKLAFADEERLALEKQFTTLQIELAKISERNRMLEESAQTSQNELAQERQFNISLHAELSRERTSRSHVEQKLEQQKTDLLQLQQRLTQEFRSLVQQILEEKSQTLTDLNKSSLNLLLQPISEKLQEFKQKIEEQHSRETHELIVLHNKLANLESGRWNRGNGVPAPPPPANPAPPASHQVWPAGHNDFAQYIATPEELAAATEFDPAAPPNSETGEPSASDAFQAFTPKQQVEIDNFFKRTLGRAQRKKPESDEDTGETKV